MAQETIDTTGQENQATLLGKIGQMFTELYTLLGGTAAASVASLTATGTVAANALTSATTAVIAGLTTTGTLKVDTGTKTAAATAGAATLSKASGKVTSEALTTAAAAVYTLTVTNTQIAAADTVFASLANGTNTQGIPVIEKVTPGAGSVVITVRNNHAAEALNGTLVVSFVSLKA